jgi:hypothetical protein
MTRFWQKGVSVRQLVFISLSMLLLITACSSIVPDAKATEAKMYANVLATITAAAPAATRTEQPLAAFAWAYPASGPTPAETPQSILTPVSSASPTATRTPKPSDLQITGFNGDQEKTVRGGLEFLKSCKPATYDYVRSQVDVVTLGEDTAATLYYFNYGEPKVFIPPKSDVFDVYRYQDTSRRFTTAVILVHAAKRLELGDDTAVSEASKFALALFDACKPKETSADPNANWLYQAFHDWLDEMAAPGCAEGCVYHKPNCDIKGEIYIEWNDKVYFLPNSKSYGAVNMNDPYTHRWFCTENEATAGGWKKSAQ